MIISRGPVTQYIIIACAVLFIASGLYPELYNIFSLYPPRPTIPGTIMHAFMHANLLHILFNMIALYQVGNILESTLGSRRYIILYLILLLGTAVLTVLFGGASFYLGASGVVMGLFAYLYALLPNSSYVRQELGYILILNISIGLAPGISFVGHFGGAVLGYVLCKAGLFRGWQFK